MRKTFLSGLLLFVAAVTLSNCSKDETTDPAGLGNQLRASVENSIVTWAVEDKIKVVNQDTPATEVEYTLSEGAGTGNGIFTATAPLSNGAKWAFYPSSVFGSCADNAFTFTLPATQEYLATSFANEAYPMVAQCAADGTLAFKNLCGIIKLQLTGNQTVASIQLKTAGEQIAGPATVAMNYTTAPTLACDAHFGTTTVTLRNINTALSDTPTSFFFVVPAGEYAAGLTFTALDDKGAVINTHTTTKALTVIRSEVAELTPTLPSHFPDPAFRASLVAIYPQLKLTADGTDIDVNNADNKKRFAITTWLEVKEKEITTLQGIEYFTALDHLGCSHNQLTNLDVSKNTALTKLDCGSNQLTNLDVSKNTALTKLDCGSNQLTSLDVSKNTELTSLSCQNNRLPSLDLSNNTALIELLCNTNILTSLYLSQNTALTYLDCSNTNLLTSLDLSKNTELTKLDCQNNPLTSLDVSKNTELTSLSCQNNRLTSLDVSKNTELTSLSCQNTRLTSLDVSKNTALTFFDCGCNQLTNLDVSKNTMLSILVCSENQLTSLDVSKNTMLSLLLCNTNLLTSLDVSKNTELISLLCNTNQLTDLDLSLNTKLNSLFCYANQLTSLDIQPLTSLYNLNCGQQLAGGAVAPNYSELKLFMTQAQFDNANLGTGDHNEKVTRVPPDGK